jgi:AraC-like DNA-binding protein
MVGLGKQNQQTSELARRLPPSYEQPMYSPHSIAAIVAELVKEGVDATVVLEGAGLSKSQLDAQTTKISYRQLDIVIRNALRLSRSRAIALRAGLRMHITSYGMYGYALLSSATHAEARDFAARYVRVVGPFCDFRVAYDGARVQVAFEPLHWPNPTEDVHHFAVEFALSAHLTTIRDRVGGGFGFSRVSLDYPAPAHAADYESLYKCPVIFEQRHCGYEHNREEGPSMLADPRTHAMAREICEQLLDDVNRAGGVAADIRQILIEHPGQYPSIERIAEKLQMYPRALRRKLEAEGTSYRDLLGEVRMRLAIEYLRKTEMTNEEIATRLGYSEAANFRHAFLRWTGKNPSEFRGGARPRSASPTLRVN